MVTHDFHGLKTMTFHRVADIAYFWLAVTEIIQFFSRNVTPEICSSQPILMEYKMVHGLIQAVFAT